MLDAPRPALAALMMLWALSCHGEHDLPEAPDTSPSTQANADQPLDVAPSTAPTEEAPAPSGFVEVDRGNGLSSLDDVITVIDHHDRVIIVGGGLRETWWRATRQSSVESNEPDADDLRLEEETSQRRQKLAASLGVELFTEEGAHETDLPGGERLLFTNMYDAQKRYGLGVLRTDAAGRTTVHRLPRRRTPYASFPEAIVARAADDVWVFASTTSGKDFDEDFPGCPIVVRHAQDGGYVAHFDGRRWTEIAWPSELALGELRVSADEIVAIAGYEREHGGWTQTIPPPRRAYRLDTRPGVASHARWTETALPDVARAESLGWQLRDGVVRHAGEVVELPVLDADPNTVRVERIVALDAHQALLQAGFASHPGSDWTWYRVRR